MPRLSALDVVSPAFEQTKNQLFKPVRAGRWARLAVVSLVTGEFASGGGGGGGGGSIPLPQGGRDSPESFLALAEPGSAWLRDFLPVILVGVLAAVALLLVWLYAASVFRFILFDSVLHDRCELRAGWRRWQPQGRSFFLWIVGFGLAFPAALGVVVGIPLLVAWRAGVFEAPKEHLALLILGGFALLLAMLAVFLAGAIVALMAKDFVVPVMALEGVGVLEGWRRVLPMIGAEKTAYAGYVLMKIVLAVGSAILFGMATLFVLLALLIPLGIAGTALYLLAQSAGVTWTPATIGAAVVAGGAVLALIFFTVALISTPATVFFQSYTLHFFGGRYPRLGEFLWPASPPQPVPAAQPASL